MPLPGRTPLLLEAPTAQRAIDPKAVTQSSARLVARQSDADAPVQRRSANSSSSDQSPSKSFHISLSRSRYPAPSSKKGKSASGYEWDLEKNPHAISGEHSVPTDSKHPTGLHHRVSTADGWDAHGVLKQIWDRRHEVNPRDVEHEVEPARLPAKHGSVEILAKKAGGKTTPTGNKYMLPHNMPGKDHESPSVRARAWKMQAQGEANTLGDSYRSSEPKPGERRSRKPAQVHIIRHKPSGRMETRSTFHGKKFQHPGKDYEVLHTAISEWLTRDALLIEGMSQQQIQRGGTRLPRVKSDADIRHRIANLTQSGSHQAAAALSASLRAREQMRKATAGLSGLERRDTPASRTTLQPARSLTPTGRGARKTKQGEFPGAETKMMWTPQSKRPPGHRTQKLAAPPGASTQVIASPEPQSLDVEIEKEQKKSKTRVMPRATVASDLLHRSPLLQELVTAGGVFATGLRAGSPLRSHPRDARHIPNPPRKSAVTTANTGHTANTGAWVPDKKKREQQKKHGGHKQPKHQTHKRVRDPITRELEAQPANVGGVLSIPMLKRSKLVG